MPHVPGHTLGNPYSVEGNMGPFGMGRIGGPAVIPRWLSDMFRTQIAPRGFGNSINTLMEQIGNIYPLAGGINVRIGNPQGFGNRMNTAMGQMAGYTPPSPSPFMPEISQGPIDPVAITPGQTPVPVSSIPQPMLDALNTGITGRPVQTGRTEGGFAPVQAPIGQQNQYVGPTPMEAWESNLGGSPSFAQTMGQLGRQRAQQQADAPRTRAQYLAGQNRRRGGL